MAMYEHLLTFSTLRLIVKISYRNKKYVLCIKIACIIQNSGKGSQKVKQSGKHVINKQKLLIMLLHCTLQKWQKKMTDLRPSILSAHMRKKKAIIQIIYVFPYINRILIERQPLSEQKLEIWKLICKLWSEMAHLK